MKALDYITERKWATIKEAEALPVSVVKYTMFDAQMSRIITPWIQYTCKKVHELLHKEIFQSLIYREQPKSVTTYK